MLIYNHKKEFIGIDESDLSVFGFSNLEELKQEVDDFADSFVKKPGLIHNFTHVSWIDFILTSDNSTSIKVLININSRNFKANLHLTTVYLSDNPASKAYSVHLQNIIELTDNEAEYSSVELLERTDPTAVPVATPKASLQKPIEKPQSTPEPAKKLEVSKPPVQESKLKPLSLDIDTPKEEVVKPITTLKVQSQPDKIEEEEIVETTQFAIYDNGYTYDPLVASNELGLPIELINEFIEDFIAQAREFENGLYQAYNSGDTAELKAQSHKLKGVAANLRIEDALESITIVNTSDDNKSIKKELDIFYKIIAKLSGEKIQMTTSEIVKKDAKEEKIETAPQEEFKLEIAKEESNDDDFSLEFKDIDTPTSVSKTTLEPEKVDDLKLEFKEDDAQEQTPTKVAKPELIINNDFTPSFKGKNTFKYNKTAVADEIGLDIDSFNDLFQEYLEEAQLLNRLIFEAVETNSIQVWKDHIHKFKGMSRNMRIDYFDKEIDILTHTDDATAAKAANQAIEKLLQTVV